LRAMILDAPGKRLRAANLRAPVPGPEQVLLDVRGAAVLVVG
jgi:D-arabinose 1-dehydrogenase-like Zn-dependent alcohol dehydrogenase